MNRRIILCLLAVTTCVPAVADVWPSRPIKLVVQFAAGGSADTLGRTLAQALAPALKQPIVVENRPGAGGNIGTELVAKAPADGYTIMVAGANNSINATLYKNLPFDFEADLIPIAMIGVSPNLMVVNKDLPANVPDFLAFARKRGTPVTFASSGAGGTLHLTGEIFKVATGIPMVHVPYKGSSPALVDVMGGQVDVMFDSVVSAGNLVRQGKLKALAVTGPTRSPVFPNVPTLKETGINVEVLSFVGIYAPKGTPQPILDRLNKEVRQAIATPEVSERLQAMGVEPRSYSLMEFAAFNHAQVVTWRKAVLDSGAKAD
jgi:tripartite-type tricarboxylate transporter receptor subunit TctC